MAKPLLPDEAWAEIQSLLPQSARKVGRRRLDDRAALTGILFILRYRVPWDELPLELNCGSGMTCWRRLRSWQRSGVWNKIATVLRAHVSNATAELDWDRLERDTAAMRAKMRDDHGLDAGPTSDAS